MELTVHHLNCGTFHPPGGRLVTGRASPARPAKLVCHCLLVETPADGLVLIDTGIGSSDIVEPAERLGTQFLRTVRPVLRAEETALRQVVEMGHSPDDVRHIVLTHLDRDHVGGLADFPAAQVHVHQQALTAAEHPATRRDRDRHRQLQFAHRPHWQPHETGGGNEWFGLEAVQPLPGLSQLLLVSLPGHSRGHAGVAVRTRSGADERWLLHAGDAYFFHGETGTPPCCPPGLRLFQRKAQASQQLRRQTKQRLRALGTSALPVTVFCAHDPVELDALRTAAGHRDA